MEPNETESDEKKVSIVASCLVKNEGKYLMVEEDVPELGPVWHPPSGTVGADEEIEDAAIRHTLEQTGYEVRLGQEIGLYHELATKSIKHVYSAEILDGAIEMANGSMRQVAWLPFTEIEILHDQGRLRAPWVWNVIQKVSTDHHPSGNDLLKYM